jgi:hypothetical protein
MESKISELVLEALKDKDIVLQEDNKAAILSELDKLQKNLNRDVNKLFEDAEDDLKDFIRDHKLDIDSDLYIERIMRKVLENISKSY